MCTGRQAGSQLARLGRAWSEQGSTAGLYASARLTGRPPAAAPAASPPALLQHKNQVHVEVY